MSETQPTLTFKDWDPSWGIWGVIDPMDLDNGWYGPNSRQPLDDELLDKLAWMVEQGAPTGWRFFTPTNDSGHASTLVVFGVVGKDQSERYQGLDVVTLARNPATSLLCLAFNLHITIPMVGNARAYPGYEARKSAKVSSPIGDPIVPQSANPPTEFGFAPGHDPSKYVFGQLYKTVGADGVVVTYMRMNYIGPSVFFGSTVTPGWTKRIDLMFAKDLT